MQPLVSNLRPGPKAWWLKLELHPHPLSLFRVVDDEIAIIRVGKYSTSGYNQWGHVVRVPTNELTFSEFGAMVKRARIYGRYFAASRTG